jgi:hypothetical protein
MEINFTPKNAGFNCENCNFICSKNSDWVRHCSTVKHTFSVNGNKMENASQAKYAKILYCNCGKKYTTTSGLWKHKKVCKNNKTLYEEKYIQDKTIKNLSDKDDLILTIIKQNAQLVKENHEFKNLILEIVKKDTHITTNNSNNTNNSHNKTFNLNLFLNETCKDAMNIMDFVESIQLQLSDLENVGRLGYVEGITNIITKNLNALDVTQRPIHCTDKKREVLYIKDDNKWEKEDDDKKKIRKAIKRVASKNHRLILKFKEAHPDCLKSSSNFSDQYNKIIIESCGGPGDNDLEKEDKIIRNISKTVIVDK